jgi:hypothetical protein
MRNIAERTMLLRGHVALPGGLPLETEEFQNSWSFVLSGDTPWLDKELRARGLHFIRSAKGLAEGGVGQTSQTAIASALERALRHVNSHFNAAGLGIFRSSNIRGSSPFRSKSTPIRFRIRRTRFYVLEQLPRWIYAHTGCE